MEQSGPDVYLVYRMHDVIACEIEYCLTTPKLDVRILARGESLDELASDTIRSGVGMKADSLIQSISFSFENGCTLSYPVSESAIEKFRNAYRRLLQERFLGKKAN